MQSGKVLLNDLISDTKQELLNEKFSKQYLHYILKSFQQLSEYADKNGQQYYSANLVDSFMAEKYSCFEKDGQKLEYRPATIRRKLCDLKKLEWVSECSRLERNHVKIRKPFPQKWTEAFNRFDRLQAKRNYSANTKSRYMQSLHLFAEYMVSVGIDDITKISATNISDYILTMRGNAPSTMQGDLGRIRRFLKLAYLEGYTEVNLEYAVPKLGNSSTIKDANIWSKDELEQLLSVTDRGNATGKRDYAIILMAIDLGMRTSDIISLQLENVDWSHGSVEFNQCKTKGVLCLPLTERIGLAIIDYLKYGRPKTDCQNIFIEHTPPYNAMNKFSDKFSQYVNKADITKNPNRRYGMHSLRHTVATRMLESNISFDIIFPFIGHADENTLSRYLNTDIENLRKCALSFGMEVADAGI